MKVAKAKPKFNKVHRNIAIVSNRNVQLRVTYKPLMLSVVMQNVIMVNVAAPSDCSSRRRYLLVSVSPSSTGTGSADGDNVGVDGVVLTLGVHEQHQGPIL